MSNQGGRGLVMSLLLKISILSLVIVIAALLLPGLGSPGVTILAPAAASAQVPLPDYNEPNNNFAEATPLVNGETAWGAITQASDQDYFYLDLPSRSRVNVVFTTNGYLREGKLAFQQAGTDMIVDLDWEHYDDDGSFVASGTAGPGRLFVMISVGRGTPSTMPYEVTVSYVPLTSGGFTDVPPGSPFYAPITYLADEGVVSGYPGGKFRPELPVTRQQFAKMIVRAVGYPVSSNDECPFVDVYETYPGHYLDPNDPLYPDHYVAVAAAHNITQGVKPQLFYPWDSIKLAQVVTMVVRTGLDVGVWDAPPHSYEPPFPNFGAPHYEWARMGAAHGLFDGYPGPWGWWEPASRGQCAFFIWKLMLALGNGPYPMD